MRTSLLLTILLVSIAALSTAQVAPDIRWADEVVSHSSQYGDQYYSADQALGVPDAYSPYDLPMLAWVPRKESNNLGEYIRVRFSKPMQGVRQLIVSQTLNPGAIARIYLYDESGDRHLVYDRKEVGPSGEAREMFVEMIAPTRYAVAGLKLELRTARVPGSNHIDAIGISTSTQPYRYGDHINAIAYAEDVSRPKNLGPQVNSAYAERLPIISPDGNTLYFARKYHPENDGTQNHDDIWVSHRTASGDWSAARNLGAPLNNEQHNFVIAAATDGRQLYLANDYRGNRKDGLSISYRQGDTWSRPELMPIEDHYNDSKYVGYHVSDDGRILLMSVQRKEGYGKRDLYVSFRQRGDSWSRPRNLGPQVNTVGIESSVFLAADGKTMYFASSGHYGYGGLDMYMTRRLDDTWTNWTTPVNLGERINTPGNDFNYSIPYSGEYAYFSSDKGGYGMSDLYRIDLPREVRPLNSGLQDNLADADFRDYSSGSTYDNNDPPSARQREIDRLRAELNRLEQSQSRPRAEIDDNRSDREQATTNRRLEDRLSDYYADVPATPTEPSTRARGTDSRLERLREKYRRAYNEGPAAPATATTPREEYDLPPPVVPSKVTDIDYDARYRIQDPRQTTPPTKPATDNYVGDLKERLEQLEEQPDTDNAAAPAPRPYSEPAPTERIGNSRYLSDRPLKVGEIIPLENIFFDANKAILKPGSYAALDEAVAFLSANPTLIVEVGGHTNSLCASSFAFELSTERARQVSAYFEARGIPASRILHRGYGKTRPIDTNETAAGRKRNQRVELKVIEVVD